MLQIGLVGLGSISEKAYLPFMRQLPMIHWHLCTRQSEVLDRVASLFGKRSTYKRLEDLAQVPLDGVFIHTATVSHVAIAELFLNQGIPVYMDKPLAESYEEAKALYDLAEANQTFLMAGFNRRFAPKVSKMKTLGHKKKIYVEKNAVNSPGELRFKLFDIFIHPLDTALFLLDEAPIRGYFQYHKEKDLLVQATLVLETEESTVIVGMNLQSGSRREVMTVETPEATYQLENLDQLSLYQGNQELKDAFDAWDTLLYKRGFESAVLAFLEAIDSGVNPVSRWSSLQSHWICQVMAESEASSGLLQLKLE